jgi:hypothetical protein
MGPRQNRQGARELDAAALDAAALDAAALDARDGAPAMPVEILGTWDYKWPLGTTIRVAFQRLAGVDEKDFVGLRDRVIELATRWETAVQRHGTPSLRKHCPKLEFVDPSGDLAPPLGPEFPFDQHRSPFADRKDIISTGYDVLVSLQPLPVVRVDRFRSEEHREEPIEFPVSELGSYARRADYGAPTMYIGPFGTGKEQARASVRASAKGEAAQLVGTIRAFLDTPLGEHVVVHEFGHVFGLPHLFQQPELFREPDKKLEAVKRAHFYLKEDELVNVVHATLGIELSKATIKEHVLDIWPGSKQFSDRAKFTDEELKAHRESGKLDTVMGWPYYRRLTKLSLTLRLEPEADAPATMPSPKDLQLLDTMYAAPL